MSCLEDASPEILNLVWEYLMVRDLAAVDGTGWTLRQQTSRRWYEISRQLFQTGCASSAAQVDLQASCTTKQHAICHYRASILARKMEAHWSTLDPEHSREDPEHMNVDDDDNSVPSLSSPQQTQINAFVHPENYFFYALLRHKDPFDSNDMHIIWEGFVSPIAQGGWEASTILFFHLYDVPLNWTEDLERLLVHPAESEEAHEVLAQHAMTGLHLTMVVLSRHSQMRPQLLFSSKGIQSFSQDNRIYYHMNSRLLHSDQTESNETWVYPRLVANKARPGRPGSLLGLRVVCWGVL